MNTFGVWEILDKHWIRKYHNPPAGRYYIYVPEDIKAFEKNLYDIWFRSKLDHGTRQFDIENVCYMIDYDNGEHSLSWKAESLKYGPNICLSRCGVIFRIKEALCFFSALKAIQNKEYTYE